MAVKWEHAHDACSENHVKRLLANRSAEGWELVSALSSDSGVKHGYPIHFDLFFKRPVESA
jgi:hypothetical protein